MARTPRGRLVKGQCKPICRDCAMYFFKYCMYSFIQYLAWIPTRRLWKRYESRFKHSKVCEKKHYTFRELIIIILNDPSSTAYPLFIIVIYGYNIYINTYYWYRVDEFFSPTKIEPMEKNQSLTISPFSEGFNDFLRASEFPAFMPV